MFSIEIHRILAFCLLRGLWDLRTDSHILYVQATITEYLNMIGDHFDEFGIQRKREKHRAYARMKSDLKEGALLPTITLSIKSTCVAKMIELIENNDNEEIIKYLSTSEIYNILDGLQRTYILKELKDAKFKFKQNQKLLLEFWVEKDIKHLIYRLIVLNAGQKRIQAGSLNQRYTFESFDFRFNNEALPSTTIRDLATCHFIEKGQSLILCGPPGMGKTHIAHGIGHEICQRGYDALFFKTHKLLERLMNKAYPRRAE
jgi:chromosomal replication initiation ATPase DnaA